MDTPELNSHEAAPPPPGGDAQPEEAPRTPRASKRKRPPLSEEQRRRATARQRIARHLERMGGDVEALERAAALIDGGTSGKPTQAPEAEPARREERASTPTAAAAPPPGWPTDEATAKALPLAKMAVDAVAAAVGLAGVDLAKPRVLGAGMPPMVFTEQLTAAAAPVMALYAPDFLTTPLGGLIATVAMVASVCIAEAVTERAKAAQLEHQARKAEGAGTAAPSVVASA